MIPNAYLNQYSNEDVQKLIASGSVTSNFDSTGNLLIDYFSESMPSSSISILLESVAFDSTKIEEKYDVVIREFANQ